MNFKSFFLASCTLVASAGHVSELEAATSWYQTSLEFVSNRIISPIKIWYQKLLLYFAWEKFQQKKQEERRDTSLVVVPITQQNNKSVPFQDTTEKLLPVRTQYQGQPALQSKMQETPTILFVDTQKDKDKVTEPVSAPSPQPQFDWQDKKELVLAIDLNDWEVLKNLQKKSAEDLIKQKKIFKTSPCYCIVVSLGAQTVKKAEQMVDDITKIISSKRALKDLTLVFKKNETIKLSFPQKNGVEVRLQASKQLADLRKKLFDRFDQKNRVLKTWNEYVTIFTNIENKNSAPFIRTVNSLVTDNSPKSAYTVKKLGLFEIKNDTYEKIYEWEL